MRRTPFDEACGEDFLLRKREDSAVGAETLGSLASYADAVILPAARLPQG